MANDSNASSDRFVFPRWANYLLPLLVLGAVGGGLYVPVVVGLGLSADTLSVGYEPEQPVPFSHALHVDELGMDCRVCHTTVEDSAVAAVPQTDICIDCHSPEEGVAGVRKTSEQLEAVFESYATGEPVRWVRVHDLPDHVYFDHSAHVSVGVSCVECHGRVDKMDTVQQAEPMSMSWCLDCHRDPEGALRPPDVSVTNLGWDPRDHPLAEPGDSREAAQLRISQELDLKEQYNIHDRTYMESCSTCHR